MAKKKILKTTEPSADQKASYPRHNVTEALRIPQAIIEQNAGRECTDNQAAQYVNATLHGNLRMEVSSAIKYGWLERPKPGWVKPTDAVKKALRPQEPTDRTESLRAAVLQAPQLGDVYQHYRGENLPDSTFFDNALVDNFHIPQDKLSEFKEIFTESLRQADLIEERDGRIRLIDVSQMPAFQQQAGEALKRLEASVEVEENASCFVMMPFAPPHGNYYEAIYKPAIVKAGLKPMRADNEIFGTGKVMDQIYRGIKSAKVLVAELTTRNANVFYELGVAHALEKPVVLVTGSEHDVPFDIRHIRVIHYDVTDPKWGDKLVEKVAEHILSAIKNPEEAIFRSGPPIQRNR